MPTAPARPLTVTTAQIMFFVNAGFWVLAAAVSGLRQSGGSLPAALLLAGLMLGNAGALLLVGLGLGRRRAAFYLGAAVAAVNLALSITDDFGLLDLISLAYNAAPLGVLFLGRRQFLAPA